MFSLTSLVGDRRLDLASIAEAFSIGEFPTVFPYLDENIVWTVTGENQFIGKQAVIDNCLKAESYFNSVTIQFETMDIITEHNKVVVNGTAEFIKDNKQVSFISACDIYEFNSKNKITSIISYCVQHKKMN